MNAVSGLVQVHGIAPWPLDAGAEIIHGEGSDVATLLQDVLHMELTEREYPNYVYWHDKGVIEYVGEQTNVTHPVVKHMYDLLDEVRPHMGTLNHRWSILRVQKLYSPY